MRVSTILALSLPLLAAAPGWGQAPPNVDIKAIKEKVRTGVAEVMAASEEKTVTLEGIVKITYKAMPTNPQRIAEILKQQGKLGNLPPNVDIDQYIGMFRDDITEMLNENLATLGTIEPLVPLRLRSKKLPVGSYPFGLAFDGERPVAFVITPTDEEVNKGKPLAIKLKTASVDLMDELSVELIEPKKQKEGKEKFDIRISFMRSVAQTKSELQRTDDD